MELLMPQRPTAKNSWDWYPPDIDPRSYIFTTSSLPDNPLYMPTVGNGHLATVVYRDRLFVNGIYNGADDSSHRAAIPAWGRVKVLATPQVTEVWSLDVIQGVFSHTLTCDQYEATHVVYAHRTHTQLLVNELQVRRFTPCSSTPGCVTSHSCTDIVIKLDAGTQFTSPDITVQSDTRADGVRTAHCMTLTPETEGCPLLSLYVVYDAIPDEIVLPSSEVMLRATYLFSVSPEADDACSAFNQGRELMQSGDLRAMHSAGWQALWQAGRIDFVGDLRLSSTTYGCLYYLLSSLPTPPSISKTDNHLPFFGLSPESLAYGDRSEDDYEGHVFWDQETWMFPPILLLYPEIAHDLMLTRTRVLDQAIVNAKQCGESGARFPWEQARTGIPTSPSQDCEKYEIHINADISFAVRQYIYATLDRNWLECERGLELAINLSDFWKSRLVWNSTRAQYSINDVMPPDEWHYPVNNSTYTNMAANLAIQLPDILHRLLLNPSPSPSPSPPVELTNDPNIFIPFDEQLQYHPEFEGYQPTEEKSSRVKQADVILIGFPLEQVSLPVVRKNDLEIYEKATSANGPAMTWSMFAIGHLELKQKTDAHRLFVKQYDNIMAPFKVWSENPGGSGALNFITGMGGFLQSLLFGYGGVRFHQDSLTVDPVLPEGTTQMNITGLSFRGSKFTVLVLTAGQTSVTLTARDHGEAMLVLGDKTHVLEQSDTVTFDTQPFKLMIM